MPINFPDSPTVDQTFTVGGTTWKWTGTVWDTVTTAVNPVSVSPNYIINGAFDFWQRGTSFTGNEIYTADRWYFVSTGRGNQANITRLTSSLPDNFQFGLSMRQINSTVSNFNLAQSFEEQDVIPLVGRTVTLSFWARLPIAFTNAVRANLRSSTTPNQKMDAFSTQLGVVTISGTSWQRYTLSVTVPANARSFGVGFESYDSTVTDAELQITGVQVELGSSATPFKRAATTLQGELAACERYYQTSLGSATTHSLTTTQVVIAVNASFTTGIQFRTQMRVSPTVTVFSRNNTSGVVSRVSDGVDVLGTTTANNINATKIWGLSNNNNNFSSGVGYEASWTASAEL